MLATLLDIDAVQSCECSRGSTCNARVALLPEHTYYKTYLMLTALWGLSTWHRKAHSQLHDPMNTDAVSSIDDPLGAMHPM